MFNENHKIDEEHLVLCLKESLKKKKCNVENIEQISKDKLIVTEDLPTNEVNNFFHIGLDAISKGEVAAIVLAGGQASRLGVNVPKGTMKLGIGFNKLDSLFYLQAAQIKKLIQLAKKKNSKSSPSIPWLIMTSNSTHDKTCEHFKEIIKELNFSENDIIIFSQKEIPTLTLDGKFLYKDKGVIATNPVLDGNGGLYECLKPYLSLLEKRGVKYFHTYAVDNILVRVADPSFIGACILKGADCAAKTIEKQEPQELLGNLCYENRHVHVFEYSEITSELASRREENGKLYLRVGSIANHFFLLSFLKKICGIETAENEPVCLPFHAAKKKVQYYDYNKNEIITPTEPNAYKLEKFIFDAFYYSTNFWCYQVPIQIEFSPLKNSNDVKKDCLSTCLKDLAANHINWIKNLNILKNVDLNKLNFENVKIYVDPLLSYQGEDLDNETTKRQLINQIEKLKTIDKSQKKSIIICKTT